MAILLCDRCMKELTDEDYLFHTTFKTFDRNNPTLCSRCEEELTVIIESFIGGAIDKS